MPLQSGTRIGPYEIVERLGAGGMGEVYRARDAKLERDVAIKILRDGTLADRLARERKGRVLAALNHPVPDRAAEIDWCATSKPKGSTQGREREEFLGAVASLKGDNRSGIADGGLSTELRSVYAGAAICFSI